MRPRAQEAKGDPEDALSRRLDTIAKRMPADDHRLRPDYYLLRYGLKMLLPRLRGPRILEMGCASGGMTRVLARHFQHVVAVEGSPLLLKHARRHVRAPNVTFQNCSFEQFRPRTKFHSIVFSGILEHLPDPVHILGRTRGWLAPHGRIHIIVPNAEALNRRIGKAMGMLRRLDDLHEGDRRIGHFRVYRQETLRKDVQSAGFKITYCSGILLKPLPDIEMQNWDPKLLDALFEVGKEIPRYCSEIYAECRPQGAGR